MPDDPIWPRAAALEATADTGGLLSFWCKVSSREITDILMFAVGDEEKFRISGELDWQFFSFPVPPGQRMCWTYRRWTGAPAGQNRAWLDEVSFVPATAPAISKQPLGGVFSEGVEVILAVEAYGVAPLGFQWYRDATNQLTGMTNAVLLFASVQPPDAGDYSVVISNSYGTITSAVAPVRLLMLATAVDATNLVWSTTGNSNWLHQTNVTHDGTDGAASGLVEAGGFSTMETTVTGPGTISFWWKVSSESGFDVLEFTRQEVASGTDLHQARISDEVDWQQKSFFVPPGDHKLSWTYSKDDTLTGGSDRAWLDEITYSPVRVPLITNTVQHVTTALRQPLCLSAAVLTTEPVVYKWYLNSTNELTDQTSSDLCIEILSAAQAGEYSVVAATTYGATTSVVAQVRLVSLAEALDNDLVWIESPGTDVWSFWSADTRYTYTGLPTGRIGHDGVDCASVGPSESPAFLETTVSGPGALTFWWAAPSPPEVLRLYTNGVLAAENGAPYERQEWQFQYIELGSGVQTLRWGYSRKESEPFETYGVFLDEVTFIPAGTPPLIVLPPTNIIAAELSSITIPAQVIGLPPLDLQWMRDGTLLLNETNSHLVIELTAYSQSGGYQLRASNAFGVVTSAVAQLVVRKRRGSNLELQACVEIGSPQTGVHVVGTRAYVVEADVGLRVFDVADPTNVVMIGSSQVPGIQSVTVSNSLAYLACGLNGVRILDVANPTNLFPIGEYDTKGSSMAITLQGSRAYIADGSGGMLILDVSTPTNISALGVFRPVGEVRCVRIRNNLAYVASSGAGVYVVDVTDPYHPREISVLSTLHGSFDLQLDGDVLYVLSLADGTTTLSAFALDPLASVVPLNSISMYSPGAVLPRLELSPPLAVIGLWDWMMEFTGFQFVDCSDPHQLLSVGEAGTGVYPADFQIIGDRVFVANERSGFCIYQLNEIPTPPRITSSRIGGGYLNATIKGLRIGSRAVMEASTNLVEWLPFATNVVTSHTIEVSAPGYTEGAMFFMRVRSE